MIINTATYQPHHLSSLTPTAVPEAPPPTPPGAVMVAPDPPFWVPAAISFVCRESKLSPLNTMNYTIFGNESGWSYLDPDFGCYNGS